MPNAYTSTGSTSLGGTVGGAGLVQKAYEMMLSETSDWSSDVALPI